MKRKIFIGLLSTISILGHLTVFRVFAAENNLSSPMVSLELFKKLPVLDEGRVKPLDSYARSILLRFSGRQSFQKKQAIEWLAALVFTPEQTQQDKIFLINNPEVALALNIVPEEHRRYSYSQIEQGYRKLGELAMQASKIDEKKRTAAENEFVRVFDNVYMYNDISNTFIFANPMDEFEVTSKETKKFLGLPAEKTRFSYLDIAMNANAIQKVMDSIHNKKPDQWSALEKDNLRLLTGLYQMANYFHNMPFNVIAPVDSKSDEWLSPWDAIANHFSNTTVRNEIAQLQNAVRAYQEGNQKQFDGAVSQFYASIEKRTAGKHSVKYISLEVLYNQLGLFNKALVCYGFAMILIITSLVSRKRFWYQLAFGFTLLGFLPHLFALIARIIIMWRPPVTNLYETFIYVGLLAVVLGLLVELVNRSQLGIVAASISGFAFLLIANKFSADGDTMKMLVAVLNSNFWLTIHVLHITAGYAACCVAGLMGHIYLIQAVAHPKDQKALNATYQYVVGILGLGLALTVLGTTMGGVWADQSWGRFWGWDPKENGALLIILWCTIVIHAKTSKLVGSLGFVVGCAAIIIIVMWAWFGVNLLSVGLHSYGFTQGIATNLFIFYGTEFLFLSVITPLAFYRLKKAGFKDF